MTRLLFTFCFSLLSFSWVSTAVAEPPKIKMYTMPYNALKQQCQKDVVSALKKAKYKNKVKASKSMMFSATKNNTRVVISCISPSTKCEDSQEVDRLVIVVTGDDAKVVKKNAVELVDLFYVF